MSSSNPCSPPDRDSQAKKLIRKRKSKINWMLRKRRRKRKK
jgi:hypothetical protein